ncbi:MAG: hypothetical protein M3323_10955 [Actinomycetota bacterium]|nr:hypothetical protein [Actinomycetota bacterium]
MKKILASVVLVVLVGSVSVAAYAKGARRPANDESSAASVVETLPFSETVSLKGATLQPDEVQPSCSPIRSSIWYALSPPEEGTVMGDVSSTFSSALAVYEQTAEGLPLEVACTSGQAGSALEFKGSPGKLYLVQLSSTGKKQGIADVAFYMSSWKDIALIDQTFQRTVDEHHFPIVRLKGQPRPSDPSMYDVNVMVSDQQKTVGILTFGLVKEKMEAELVHIPKIATTVRLQVTGRYDSSQYRCAADDGGGTCYLGAPLRDMSWLTGGEASRAELVVTISVQKDDRVILERSQSIPYAGQALGLLP